MAGIVIPALWALTLAPFTAALDNGLAPTPPMGWLTWQRFRCVIDCENFPDECISETLIKRTADRMVSDGYLAAGYEYLGIDDCWLEQKRGADGRLVPDRKRFPSGMKALADYIHSKGLKFALYQDYGTKTCAGYPGILGNEKLDMDTFAEWDVDYIKLDGCYVDTAKMDTGYPYVGRLLNATGRPIVYSCSWPAYQKNPNYEAIAKACNLWRNYDDIEDSWSSVVDIMNWFGERSKYLAQFAGPGNWNDPDMLIIGNYGLSEDQARVQMAIWAVLAAPLMMSVDLATIKPAFRDILLNKDIIAVNQDSLGKAGYMVACSPCDKNNGCGATAKHKIWMRVLSDGSNVIAIVNLSDDGVPKSWSLIWDQNVRVEDLYHEETTRFIAAQEKYRIRVNPSGVKFLKFTHTCAEDVCSQDLRPKIYDEKDREQTC